MVQRDRPVIVVGRLRGSAVLVFVVLMATIMLLCIAEQLWGDGFAGSALYPLFGRLLGPLAIGGSGFGVWLFVRMWRERGHYLHHDGVRLYKGSDGSWPLANVRDVIVTRNWLGIGSLRLVVDDDSETTRELAKLYMLADAPETVRGGVMFAVGGARGFPLASAVH